MGVSKSSALSLYVGGVHEGVTGGAGGKGEA